MSELPSRIVSLFDGFVSITDAYKSVRAVSNAETQIIKDRTVFIVKNTEELAAQYCHEIVRLTSLMLLSKTFGINRCDKEILTQVISGEIAYFLHRCVINLFDTRNASERQNEVTNIITTAREILINATTKLVLRNTPLNDSQTMLKQMVSLINATPYTINTDTFDCTIKFPAAVAYNAKLGRGINVSQMMSIDLFVSEEMLAHTKQLYKQLTELAKQQEQLLKNRELMVRCSRLETELATKRTEEKNRQLEEELLKNQELAERCRQLEEALSKKQLDEKNKAQTTTEHCSTVVFDRDLEENERLTRLGHANTRLAKQKVYRENNLQKSSDTSSELPCDNLYD